jgi:hypothetical protein
MMRCVPCTARLPTELPGDLLLLDCMALRQTVVLPQNAQGLLLTKFLAQEPLQPGHSSG